MDLDQVTLLAVRVDLDIADGGDIGQKFPKKSLKITTLIKKVKFAQLGEIYHIPHPTGSTLLLPGIEKLMLELNILEEGFLHFAVSHNFDL